MEPIQYSAALAAVPLEKKNYLERGLERSLKDNGTENSATFSKYLKVNLQSVSSEFFLALVKHVITTDNNIPLFSGKHNFFWFFFYK